MSDTGLALKLEIRLISVPDDWLFFPYILIFSNLPISFSTSLIRLENVIKWLQNSVDFYFKNELFGTKGELGF